MEEDEIRKRYYGEFKPSSFKCNLRLSRFSDARCQLTVKNEKDYHRHLKEFHGIK